MSTNKSQASSDKTVWRDDRADLRKMAASIHCADNAIESSDEEPDDLTACCDMAQTLLPNESRAEVKTRVNTYFTALTKERKSQGLTEEPSKDELQAMLRAHLQSTESKG